MPNTSKRLHYPSPNKLQIRLKVWEDSKKSSDELEVYMDSVTLNLHGIYSGIERIFELIARRVDQNMPAGDLWHRKLLKQMSQDKRDIRPSVIGSESFGLLLRYGMWDMPDTGLLQHVMPAR